MLTSGKFETEGMWIRSFGNG